MNRKLILALSAAAALAAAALSPTTASAWGWNHHHWHHGYGFGYYGPSYVGGPDCYRVKRPVQFTDGSWHKRWFTVCN
jgi:opacity protein-like surface antigen